MLFFIQEMQGHPQVVKVISACISEDGDVQDSASDELRAARGKLRGVENRLKALLKGHSGEVSEMVRNNTYNSITQWNGKYNSVTALHHYTLNYASCTDLHVHVRYVALCECANSQYSVCP